MSMKMMDIIGEDNVKVSKAKKAQMLDDQFSLIRNKDKKDNENRHRLKGRKNKNNPINDIKQAREVVIVKQANYMDCISCHLCIGDNVYKIYDANFQPIFTDSDYLKRERDPVDIDSIEPPEESP